MKCVGPRVSSAGLDARAPASLSSFDALSRRLLRRAVADPTGRWPVVLMYHAIDPPRRPSGWSWAITADRFASHLDLFQGMGIRTLHVDQVEAAGSSEASVVITFDDGYADNHEWALPALVDRQQTGTWFIPSATVGRRPDWLDGAERSRSLMDRQQLQEILAAGMEVGGHGRSHRPLIGLPPQEMEEEVAGCRVDLEDLFGIAVTSFAYPYGRYDATARAAAGDAGYRYACTTRPGWWRGDSDPLQVRRVAVFADDTAGRLARKLCFADNDVRWHSIARYYTGRIRARFMGTTR
jgi:peptidoglycan/xylan/chitin deacetylase (PgdA/CDA1 family)